MKSLILVISVLCFLATSCQVETKRGTESTSTTLVDPKYSLSKDRSEFEKLRQSIPDDVKKKNDESALMAELFSNLKHPPEYIREKFTDLVRKKRELFNKDLTRSREEYNKNERKSRESFLKELEDERKSFLEKKMDREKRSDFFNDQDENRREYFSEQKDKREEFEADIREKRKDFDDYIKEKTNDFNAELQDYKIRWKENTKQE